MLQKQFLGKSSALKNMRSKALKPQRFTHVCNRMLNVFSSHVNGLMVYAHTLNKIAVRSQVVICQTTSLTAIGILIE